MTREIIEAVLVRQLRKYIKEKELDYDSLLEEELKTEALDYIKNAYPGIKGLPIDFVEGLASTNMDTLIESDAIFNPEKKLCNNEQARRKR